jgi:hypothetical protein
MYSGHRNQPTSLRMACSSWILSCSALLGATINAGTTLAEHVG